MKYYKLRLDLEKASVDAIVEYLRKVSSYFVYVVEGSQTDNPHLHVWLGTLVKSPTMRVHFRKLTGGGNGGYSLKETDDRPIEYLAYMMKEGKVVWVGIPEDIIEEATAHDAKVKAEMAEKRKAKLPAWKQCYGYVIEKYGCIPYNRAQVIECVLDWHVGNDRMIRRNQICAIVDTCMVYGNPDHMKRFVESIDELMTLRY